MDVVCGKFTSKRLERGREVGVWRGGEGRFCDKGGGGEERYGVNRGCYCVCCCYVLE